MKRLAVLLLALVLFSCVDNNKTPAGIIPPQKMETIFWDMIQADRYAVSFLPRQKDTAKRKAATVELYQKIFAVHGIDQETFQKSYAFYMSRPDLSKVMFDSMTVRGERRKKEIYDNELKKDSLEKMSSRDSATAKRVADSMSIVNKDSLVIVKKDSLALRKKDSISSIKSRSQTQKNDSLRELKIDSLRRYRNDSLFLRRNRNARPAVNTDSLRRLKNRNIELLK